MMRFNSGEEKDGRWMFLSQTTKNDTQKKEKKKKRNRRYVRSTTNVRASREHRDERDAAARVGTWRRCPERV